ncbi:MAG: glycosyltransferase family 2 protein [Firmicutes bacterium]|nr:glycosyltransferase family 2 protein [Bacillota bacterium]
MTKKATEPVTVVIPAYNEAASIVESVNSVRESLSEAGIDHEIIVVDDGSSDQTYELALGTGVTVVRHKKNKGYGASLKTGIGLAKNDLIVITDADGTYPPSSIPPLIEGMKDADMVVGARVGQNVNIPLVRQPAKWFLRCLAGYITGERIPDLNSGLRAFRRQCVQQYMNILPDKFSFTTTITVAMLCDNYEVVYLPIDYHKRTGKSKIVPWDFVNFTTLVIRLSMLFNPLKIFLPVSLASLILGLFKLVVDILVAINSAEGLGIGALFTREVISASSLIFLISSLQILLIGMVADGIIRKFGRYAPQPLTYPVNKNELQTEQAASQPPVFHDSTGRSRNF